jgi:D-sedoheptulose 7-phosphate isomerase
MNKESLKIIKNYLSQVTDTLNQLQVDKIAKVVEVLDKACVKGRRVFIFGNGGSAATASHFASDLAKGAICKGKPRFKAFALTDNVPLLSAWANDTDYGNIFSEQLENFVEPGDIAIAISGSGNSLNVLNGAKTARAKGATTIGFIGFDGGKLKDLVDIALVVPNHNMEQVEDIHLLLEHVITTCLRVGGGNLKLRT